MRVYPDPSLAFASLPAAGCRCENTAAQPTSKLLSLRTPCAHEATGIPQGSLRLMARSAAL